MSGTARLPHIDLALVTARLPYPEVVQQADEATALASAALTKWADERARRPHWFLFGVAAGLALHFATVALVGLIF